MANLNRQFNIRVSDPEEDAYEKAAASAGMSKGVWARTVLNAAVGLSPLGDQVKRGRKANEKLAGDHAAETEKPAE